MRAQQHLLAVDSHLFRKIEGIVHRTRGMGFRNVERAEIMPVILDLGPFGDGKAHIGEDLCEFIHHLTDGMHRTARSLGRGKRHIEPLRREALVEDRRLQRGLFRRNAVGYSLAQSVNHRPLHLPLFRRHLAKRLEERRYAALLA